MAIKSVFRVFCLSTILAIAACAGVNRSARDNRGGIPQELFSKAFEGDPWSQHEVGIRYEYGDGVAVNYSEAFLWFRRAAAQGYAPAELDLGYLYNQGLGVPTDCHAAMMWYKRAAEQKNSMAQNDIGWLYETGCGVTQDYVQALIWFTKAAMRGNSLAQRNLGDMYSYGYGIKRDEALAIKWYTASANQDDFEAQLRLGTLLSWGSTKNLILARFWFQKAASHKFETEADFESALRDIIDANKFYPAAEIKRKITGIAYVEFTYLNGRASKTHILKSSGNATLDETAIQSVNNSIFPSLPLSMRGKDMTFTVAMVYSLGA